MKRPVLNEATVRAAIDRAKDGKGRQLALLIKSIATDDLARGLSRAGLYYKGQFEERLFLAGLTTVLAVVEGRSNGRAEFAQWRKEARAACKREAETGEIANIAASTFDTDIADRFEATRPLRADDLDQGRQP